MKTLFTEDDVICRLAFQRILSGYGPCHAAANGREAVEAVRGALEAGEPYDLVCLDVMMPEMDGHAALKAIRELERERGIATGRPAKIFMTTVLDDMYNVLAAFEADCDAYLIKPISQGKLANKLRELGLVSYGKPDALNGRGVVEGEGKTRAVFQRDPGLPRASENFGGDSKGT